MTYPFSHGRHRPGPLIVHHVVCQHRLEIEVWPPAAEVYFRDEPSVDPLNTQVRFHAALYNARSHGISWEVQSLEGGPGVGSIDATGLYVAPLKGSIAHGTTVTVIATADDDPLRNAFARVTLVGFGPKPPPPPKLEIFPKQAFVYYPANHGGVAQRNEFIDASNKMQLFRALLRNTDSTAVSWFVDSGAGYVAQPGNPEPWYVYQAVGSGPDAREIKVKAQLNGFPDAYDEAKIVLVNYSWPGIVL